jgi:hypothetical protein
MNRFIQISQWLFLPAILGILLLWGGVTLMGLIAVYVTEQRFFDFPVQSILVVEDFLAWVPLSLFLGGITGYFCKSSPILAGVTMAIVAILFLSINLTVDDKFSNDLNAFFSTLLFLLRTAGPFMLIFSPLGAYCGARFKRRIAKI